MIRVRGLFEDLSDQIELGSFCEDEFCLGIRKRREKRQHNEEKGFHNVYLFIVRQKYENFCYFNVFKVKKDKNLLTDFGFLLKKHEKYLRYPDF
jgi:hypothetical protein